MEQSRMQNTLANLKQYAENVDLELVQIDGIPEGFSYKIPDVTINNAKGEPVEHKGDYVAFVPNAFGEIRASKVEDLVKAYNEGVILRDKTNGK